MTIQLDIDEKILAKVAEAAKTADKSQTDYILDAINKSLLDDQKRLKGLEKEKQFIESYKRRPQEVEEYEIWQDEQVWENV